MKHVSKISDARNKNEYNESHVVTAKKVPKVNFNLVIIMKNMVLFIKVHVSENSYWIIV